MSDDDRGEALARFSRLTGLPDIARIVQRGRDPENARYTIEFTDDRQVRIGTVKNLWSQAEFGKVIFVAFGHVPQRQKTDAWQDALTALGVKGAISVEEVEGESFEDAVREWVSGYLDIAGLDADRNGAAAQGKPFRVDGRVHVHAQDLAKYIRREHGESISLVQLRTALTDIGFERQTIMYSRSRRKTSRSYYVVDGAALDVAQEESP